MKTASYKYRRRPNILEDCFYWKGRGYHYSGSPPGDVMASGGWLNDDPWIALASILESAKRADYSHVSKLRPWILDKDSDPTLVSACLGLTADAGLNTDLEFLAELMIEGPNYLRIEASLAAQWSGVLWLMPFMLEAWRALGRRADRAAIEANIANLLDPIEGEPEFYGSGLSQIEYTEAVDSRLAELKNILGSDEVSISGGRPWMNQQIRLMRKALVLKGNDEWIDWGNFLIWRRKFEVYSGVDCSSFYGKKGVFQPRAAAAVLDRHLVSPRHFEAGKRYFFGSLVA
ncbi:hypothetical protein [Lysobacter capsici]|uniref:hypothetical protein n=1 Tax=Lysobacter capsici TaxID=435897 RepID=UPI00287B7DE9|nr:hypothetical protein [Lysobacter capsici]WND80516.1 hypothetical protein RJ610_25105 [Lysobacter capsici]WND85713.1 hypothetical protein RJ609_25125 [Lysobacter capsici]